nr:LytR C-terminal domain-containing protein [Corynebacterium kutscheri]
MPQTQETQQRMPLRGIAMILIAVAILIAAWGVFSLNKNTDTTTPAAKTTSAQPVVETPTSTTAQEAVGHSEEAAPVAPQAMAVSAVHVLNNSTISGLAAQVADQLRAQGTQIGEVGNYPDSVVPENTVYYSPQLPGAERAAQELAARVNAVALPRDPALPSETADPATLVLVLAGQTTVG